MKKFKILPMLLVLSLVGTSLWAQDEEIIEPQEPKKENKNRIGTPPNMWEIGLHGGYFFIAGDVDPQFGYGFGASVRKSLDHVFSLRGDFLYGMAKGETVYNPGAIRSFEMNWMSGTLFAVFSLNSVRFDKPVRKTNLYLLAGAGMNQFEVPKYDTYYNFAGDTIQVRNGSIPKEWAPQVSLGAGFAVRLGSRVNLALEYLGSTVFSKRADQLDGNAIPATFRDIANYANLRVNINLGNAQKRAEPLYWINPLQFVLDDIDQMRSAQENALAFEDSDGDGVIDQLDKEAGTAPGALVDTKGRTLDSDRDGVPDHLDREPYYTPREGELIDDNGVVVNPMGGGGGVTESRVRELIDEALQGYQPASSEVVNNNMAGLFLPMIHFGLNSSTIKYSDYGTLASIARVMKDNPNIRLVVKGYTDKTGTEDINTSLSYQRAQAVIDHFVTNHGIGRGRLVLQYGGQDDALVPTTSSFVNRRVEFAVAQPGDVEMDPPAGSENKKSGY